MEHWYLHFYVGLLFGLVVILVIALLHGLPAVTAMDRVGSDTVQVVHARGNPPSPADLSLVLVDMQFDREVAAKSEVRRIADVIRALTPLRPRAIMLDQEILETVAENVAQDFVDAVNQAASGPMPVDVVLVPVFASTPKGTDTQAEVARSPVNIFRDKSLYPHVHFASPLLLPEPDGVIRSTPSEIFLRWPDETAPEMIPTPTLSAVLSSVTTPGCPTSHALPHPPAHTTREITFSVGFEDGRFYPPRPKALRLVAEEQLEGPVPVQLASLVRCSVVLVGEIGPSAWRDMHRSPVGQMPGVLIHANALLSPWRWRTPSHNEGLYQILLTGITIVLVAGCFAAHYVLRQRRYAQGAAGWFGTALLAVAIAAAMPALGHALEHGPFDATESIKLAMEVTGVIAAAALFAWQDRIATRWGERLRPVRHVDAPERGGSTGHGANEEDWVKNLIWLTFFVVAAVILLLSLAAMWLMSGAVLLPYGLRVGSLTPVLAASLEALVKAGGRVMSLIEAPVLAFLRRVASPLLITLVLGATPTRAADPPSAEEQSGTLLSRSIMAFKDLLVRERPSQEAVVAAGRRLRGDGPELALQWLAAVPVDGAVLPTRAEGLYIAWAGGSPPFVVALRTRTGTALGSSRVGERVFYLRSFTMPDGPIVVSVTDAQQGRLLATVTPAGTAAPVSVPAQEAAAAPARAAMTLFVQGDPSWRLEALRRLASLAPADREAADALAELRRIAEGGSPP